MKPKIFSENFFKICKELENLNSSFRIEGFPSEYEGIKAPEYNNEIRLWQIPRSTGQLLKLLVLLKRPNLILELGTSAGYSALWLASGLKELKKGKIYTIELAKPKILMARNYFNKAELNSKIKQIEGDFSKVLSGWNKRIDFIFMDADKSNYYKYLKIIEPWLNKDAIIIADNALDFKDLMKDYLDYVSKSKKYYSYLLNLDHGLMISIKK